MHTTTNRNATKQTTEKCFAKAKGKLKGGETHSWSQAGHRAQRFTALRIFTNDRENVEQLFQLPTNVSKQANLQIPHHEL